MFTIYTKGRYVNALFESTEFEVVLFEDPSGSKIVIQLDKDNSNYDIIKSGDWVMAKLSARARSKIMKSGNIFFETKIYMEKCRELYPDEIMSIERDSENIRKEAERKSRMSDDKKKDLIKISESINEQEGSKESELDREFDRVNVSMGKEESN